jgi:hypothetical protein
METIMGDMADFALEAVFDDEDARMDYRTGKMTVEEAYERGLVNELGGEIGTEARCITRTCRCCGKTGLRWGNASGRWLLYDEAALHACPVVPLSAAGQTPAAHKETV